MYDDRSYDRTRQNDAFDRRDGFESPRVFGSENPRAYRSEQPPKSRSGGVRGFFGMKNAESAPSRAQDPSNVVIYSPTTFDDVQALIDYLKRREQVIVDFSGIDQTAVYRIMDFMSGAIYALNGSIQQITRNIFLFAPAGVTITVPPQFNGRH